MDALVRDHLRGYVTAALGDPGGVLIGDDTGFEKKAPARQGCNGSTRARPEDHELPAWGLSGLRLAKGPRTGRPGLYLPRSWTDDQERLAAAKIPEDTGFQTKPQLLKAMIERAIAARVPFSWITADEADGDNGPLRAFLEGQQLAYVLAVSRDHVTATAAGALRRRDRPVPAAQGLAAT